ncbi:uncharacterized protein LOC135431178 [Drosophila montana]|uniref:uncharacterized protein LOC135430723 n=1 Tax=Drosophila montana TaxID=40370 RepID=UPI00313E0A8F
MTHYAEEEEELASEPDSWELSREERIELEALQRAFLSFERSGLGTTDLEKNTIDLVEGAQPFKDRSYPLSPSMQKVVDDEVDKLLSLGVIEECNSPWSNRTTVVRTPGKTRFCLDARKVNNLTVKDAYPQPCQRLVRLMDKVIPTELRSNVFVYLDDLLVISRFSDALKISATNRIPFTCITAHASLKWLMSMKDLNGRLARWSLQLQGYDFTIEYRKDRLYCVVSKQWARFQKIFSNLRPPSSSQRNIRCCSNKYVLIRTNCQT